MAPRISDRLTKDSKTIRSFVLWNRRRVDERRRKRAEREKSRYPHRLGVLAIMKNEGRNLQEWLEHYRWQGADKLFLIDNGSTDDSAQIVQPWIESGQVELISLPGKWRQREHYWTAIKEFRIREQCQWLLVADLDEFWFSKKGGTLASQLEHYPKTDVVYCNWRNFGSGGHVAHPASLRRDITACQPDLGAHIFTKWLCRTSVLRKISNLQIHKIHGVCSSRTVSDNDRLQLNHYPIQSVEFFQDVKMTRGDAVNPVNDELRDMAYFEKADAACVAEDRILADLLSAQGATETA